MRFLIFLALVAAASAQGPLDTFDSVREALLEGTELQINLNSEECQTDLENPLFASLPMRQWQVINNNGAQSIRSDDFYISTFNPNAASFILRTVAIREDNSVTATIVNTANTTISATFNCELGVGAVVHRVINGNDLTVVDTYNEVKSVLLLGDHVEAVGILNECSNAGDALPAGVEYTVGYQITRFSVSNDGTSDEYLTFDDVALIGIGNDTEAVSTESVTIYPDGSAQIAIGVWNLGLGEQLNNITLTCSLGSALRFTIHNRDNENTYTTYTEVRESALSGHDLELIVFLELCDIVSGNEIDFTGTLFEAGSIWGDKEYIAFSSYGIGVNGNLYADVVRVDENDMVEIEYFVVSPGATAEGATGILSCPLVDAALFHAVRRERATVQTTAEVISEVQDRGQTFEVEIDFNGCDTGNVTLGSTFGGIVWQTFVNPVDGFYLGNVFALVQQNVTGTPAPGWDVSLILLLPDNTVEIRPALYDYFTGESLFSSDVIECALAPEGSVQMFRYP